MSYKFTLLPLLATGNKHWRNPLRRPSLCIPVYFVLYIYHTSYISKRKELYKQTGLVGNLPLQLLYSSGSGDTKHVTFTCVCVIVCTGVHVCMCMSDCVSACNVCIMYICVYEERKIKKKKKERKREREREREREWESEWERRVRERVRERERERVNWSGSNSSDHRPVQRKTAQTAITGANSQKSSTLTFCLLHENNHTLAMSNNECELKSGRWIVWGLVAATLKNWGQRPIGTNYSVSCVNEWSIEWCSS